jgi:ribosomal protein S18 acetylase RimI-like enzyme
MSQNNEEKEISLIVKADNQLSKNELRMIFNLYNDSFCDNRISASKKVKLAMDLLGKNDMFDWYLAKIQGNIVGMVSFVRRFPSSLKNEYYAIRPDKGENVCSLCVSSKYRQHGIARSLMEAIIQDHGDKCNIVVEIKRTSSMYYHLVKFYQSLGFYIFEEDVKPNDNLFLRYDMRL